MTIDEYALTTRVAVLNHRVANGEILKATPETDNVIDTLINSVSSNFESYCDRKFLTRTYTEYYNGKGHSVFYPNQYPVTDIIELYDDSTWEWGSGTLISGTNYRIADENSIVFKSTAYSLSEGIQNIKLTYVAGYETIPYELETACINEVLRALERIPELALFEKRSNEYLIKYVVSPYLEDTKLVLDKYKRNGAY